MKYLNSYSAMNHQVKSLIRATLCAAALMSAQAATPADPLDACNVVWTTASENAQGSMPLGNGDVGINAWVEANGDLVFYVSKRNSRINTGWGQDSIQAACLGLRDEASRLVAIRARTNRAYRFPAMWSGFDWIPDQNHGDNILTTLQFMLLQSDGRKIYVLPAWPKNWDVSFKLHAPYETTVEGIYKAGKLEKLTVTPESRAADVVNMLEK